VNSWALLINMASVALWALNRSTTSWSATSVIRSQLTTRTSVCGKTLQRENSQAINCTASLQDTTMSVTHCICSGLMGLLFASFEDRDFALFKGRVLACSRKISQFLVLLKIFLHHHLCTHINTYVYKHILHRTRELCSIKYWAWFGNGQRNIKMKRVNCCLVSACRLWVYTGAW